MPYSTLYTSPEAGSVYVGEEGQPETAELTVVVADTKLLPDEEELEAKDSALSQQKLIMYKKGQKRGK